MAISKDHAKKQPSQNPVDFYMCKQSGGPYGKAGSVPDQLKSGAMREKVMGKSGKK